VSHGVGNRQSRAIYQPPPTRLFPRKKVDREERRKASVATPSAITPPRHRAAGSWNAPEAPSLGDQGVGARCCTLLQPNVEPTCCAGHSGVALHPLTPTPTLHPTLDALGGPFSRIATL
jgi:hypothetical protein